MNPDPTDTRALRNALGRFATGVAIVTAIDRDGNPIGLTVNSFSAVSLEPPLVLVCVALTSQTLPAIQRAKRFTVSLLSTAQTGTSDWFANRPGVSAPSRFDALDGVDGALAALACDLWEDYPGGDHRILVGRVRAITLGEGRDPLVYFQRGYRGVREAP